MENFQQGHRVGLQDLIINLYARYHYAQPHQTFPFTPFWIRYDIGFIHPTTGDFMLIGAKDRLPDVLDTGKIRPNFIINDKWKPGTYQILWHYRVTEESSVETIMVEFSVVSDGIHQPEIFMENHFDIRAYMVLL